MLIRRGAIFLILKFQNCLQFPKKCSLSKLQNIFRRNFNPKQLRLIAYICICRLKFAGTVLNQVRLILCKPQQQYLCKKARYKLKNTLHLFAKGLRNAAAACKLKILNLFFMPHYGQKMMQTRYTVQSHYNTLFKRPPSL